MKKRKFVCHDLDGAFHRGTNEGESLGARVAHECVNLGLARAHAFDHTHHARKLHDHRLAPFHRYAVEHTRTLEDGFFTGLKAEEVHNIAARVAEREKNRTYVLPREIFLAAKKLERCTILISGSFYAVVEPIGKAWGFDHVYGTELEVDPDGKYYGTPDRAKVHARSKGDLLQRIVHEQNLTYDGSVVIGDSLNDASMLKLADHQLLFNPDEPLLRAFEGRSKAWLVIERRLVYASCLLPGASRHQNRLLPPDLMHLVSARLRELDVALKYL